MRFLSIVVLIASLFALVSPAAKSGTAIDPNGLHRHGRFHFAPSCPSGSGIDPNGNCIGG